MKKLAIIFGSQSFEHEISIVSAIALKAVLSCEIVYIFIDSKKDFYHIPNKKIKSTLFSSGMYKQCDKLQLKSGGFFKASMFGDKILEFDFVLNLVHGKDGEDGTIASLFEFFNIPYIGPRPEACAVSYNKHLTKAYAVSSNVLTLDFLHFEKSSNIDITNFPVIIKPARLGSSIGISIVKTQSELAYALDCAFEFDNEIIVEPFVQNIKEYNLAGCKCGGEYNFSIVEEPLKDDFLDFDKKYLDFNRTDTVAKASIDASLEFKLKQAFMKLYNNTFEGALIRCDFFVVDDEVYLNEINPIPGSMANYLFDNFEQVLQKLGKSLPKNKLINVTYEYVNRIQKAKGKV